MESNGHQVLLSSLSTDQASGVSLNSLGVPRRESHTGLNPYHPRLEESGKRRISRRTGQGISQHSELSAEGQRVPWPHCRSLKPDLWIDNPVLLASGVEPTSFAAASGAAGRVTLREASDPICHAESFLPKFSWMSGDCCTQGWSSSLHQLSSLHTR